MAQTPGAWTLAELHRLPDDGNKYELVDGELFVTQAPAPAHEELAAELRRILESYVRAQGLGRVYAPRSVVQRRGSEVEPDLMVRQAPPSRTTKWTDMPAPSLVVEILSDTTRRRDHDQKREFYLGIGIPEYWIVDGDSRTIRVIRPEIEDVVTDAALVWWPTGVTEALNVDVKAYFLAALGSPDNGSLGSPTVQP